jgi:hypothetical protein
MWTLKKRKKEVFSTSIYDDGALKRIHGRLVKTKTMKSIYGPTLISLKFEDGMYVNFLGLFSVQEKLHYGEKPIQDELNLVDLLNHEGCFVSVDVRKVVLNYIPELKEQCYAMWVFDHYYRTNGEKYVSICDQVL